MTPADTTYLMGYGSWSIIRERHGDEEPNISSSFSNDDGEILPLLSAEYSKSSNVPTASTYDTPLSSSTRSAIRLSSGTDSYSGSLSFEMTRQLSNLIFKESFMRRRSFLDIRLCDGEAKIDILGAVWNSLSISGNSGQIISCSLGFNSCNGFKENIQVEERPDLPERFLELPNVEPYWKYGAEGAESFSLSFSRNVQPVYLNESDWKGPSYLKVGMLDVNFQIICWEKWFDHLSISLGNRKIKFNSSAFVSSRGYNFSGIQGNGTKSYSINALGRDGDDQIFKFEDN